MNTCMYHYTTLLRRADDRGVAESITATIQKVIVFENCGCSISYTVEIMQLFAALPANVQIKYRVDGVSSAFVAT